jgi:hypothetical protein
MTRAAKAPPPGGGGGALLELSFPGGNDSQPIKPPKAKTQGKSGGRGSRQKGDRLERAVVRLLQDAGFGAERVPLSGSAGGSFSGDITTPLLGRDLVVEAKARANGFAQLYAWLEDRDALIIKADRREPLVVLPLRLAVEIAAAAERGKRS